MVSMSPASGGFGGVGVGVGFGRQGGGGGGKSFTLCPSTAGTDRKRASTPIRNAGRKSYVSSRKIIFAPSSLSHAAKFAGRHFSLSYRFSDGMIHDALVPR